MTCRSFRIGPQADCIVSSSHLSILSALEALFPGPLGIDLHKARGMGIALFSRLSFHCLAWLVLGLQSCTEASGLASQDYFSRCRLPSCSEVIDRSDVSTAGSGSCLRSGEKLIDTAASCFWSEVWVKGRSLGHEQMNSTMSDML